MTDPVRVIDQARQTLDRWSGTQRRDGRTEESVRQWRQLLEGDLDELVEVLTSGSDYACDLRPDSPFAGVLSSTRRLAVLRAYVSHRDRDHLVAG